MICDRLVSPEIRELVRGELRVAGNFQDAPKKRNNKFMTGAAKA